MQNQSRIKNEYNKLICFFHKDPSMKISVDNLRSKVAIPQNRVMEYALTLHVFPSKSTEKFVFHTNNTSSPTV